jgi:mono/diheme cytochrome c family protein
MKLKLMLMLAAMLLGSMAFAGGTASKSRAAAKLDTGLVIVPFAVPVAVPVAIVRQPSVLYSYRGYAAAYAAPASNVATAPVATVADDSTAILARRCASCHSGSAAQGQLSLFDDAGRLLAKLPRRRMLEAVEAGRMPQPAEAPRLSPEELDVLRRWAQPPRDLVY